MKHSFVFAVVLQSLAFATTYFACTEAAQEPANEFVAWAARHSLEIGDLEAPLEQVQVDWLREAVGSAEVVGIGESRHDTHEQLLVKSMLTRHLIEKLGFRVFILEESYAHVIPLDQFLTSGEGDLREIVSGLAGWYLWDTEGMLELFHWMREFNKDLRPEQQVRVFGMDITAPALGVRRALASIEQAGLHAPVDERALGLDLCAGDDWQSSLQRYANLPEARRQELMHNYQVLKGFVESERDKILASCSALDYRRLLFLVELGERGNEFFLASSLEQGGALREAGMARVVQWLRETEAPGSKSILWTHNLHSAVSSFRIPRHSDSALEPMGVALKKQLGDSYLAIGATFGGGTYGSDLPPGERVFEAGCEETMDGALAALHQDYFLLDLRLAKETPEALSWLRQEREWMAQDFASYLVPADAFDLVYFVTKISRERPTPAALERFQASRH